MHDADEDLDELARRAQTGDREAMEDLLRTLYPVVLGRCRRFLPFSDDAEEAAQEALLLISQKLDTWSGAGSVRGWVVVVTSNSARSTYRSLVRRAVERGAVAVPEPADPRTTSVIAGTRIDLLDAVDDLERRHPVVVESFVLRDLGGLTYDEIADATGTTLGTVKDRIHRARAFVRDALEG